MTKRKTLKIIGVSYFANIIVFGILYWIFWIKNPSSFIINNEYNEQTLKPFYFHRDMESFEKKHPFYSISETNEKIQTHFDTLNILKHTLKAIDSVIDTLDKKSLQISQAQIKHTNENFNLLVEKSTRKIQVKLDSIMQLIKIVESLQQNTKDKSTDFYNKEVILSKLQLAYSQVDLTYNNEKLKAIEYGINKYSLLQNDSIAKLSSELYEEIDLWERDRNYKLEAISYQTEAIRNHIVSYYLGQADKLGFFDFLYFSVITATSTGFGDILPNSLTVRICVSLEIFLSIFLFGFFFYYISKSNSNI